MSASPAIPTNTTNQLAPLRLQLGQIGHLALRQGQQVELTIIKRLIGHKWLVGLRGQVLRATANIPLQRGQRFTATVSIENGQLLLRQRSPSPASLLEQFQSRADAASPRLIDAMMRSGLPLTPALYQELARRLRPQQQRRGRSAPDSNSMQPQSTSKELHAETTRLLAIAYKKGLPLNREQLKYLSQSDKRDTAHLPPPPQYSKAPDMSTQLTEMLRHSLQRSSPSSNSIFALFNHIRDGADHWVALPLLLPGVAMQGQLRLRLTGKPLRTAELVVAIQEEEYRWYIHIQQFDNGAGRISLYIPDTARYRSLAAQLSGLRRALQGCGNYELRILQDDPDFDGFDSQSASPRHAVDIDI